MANFTLNGIEYKSNDKGNYFYKSTGKTDKQGNPIMMRIPRHIYEQAFDEYTAQVDEADEEWDAEDEIQGRKEIEDKKDRETEKNFNGKKTKKARRPKDVAFEADTLIGRITLTSKQVDFIKHLPDTNFWENGLDSAPWCDVLADEIGGQFAGKPMTVGAMISTLREKHLIEVGRDTSRKGNPKYMMLTETGKAVARKLGLN